MDKSAAENFEVGNSLAVQNEAERIEVERILVDSTSVGHKPVGNDDGMARSGFGKQVRADKPDLDNNRIGLKLARCLTLSRQRKRKVRRGLSFDSPGLKS